MYCKNILHEIFIIYETEAFFSNKMIKDLESILEIKTKELRKIEFLKDDF